MSNKNSPKLTCNECGGVIDPKTGDQLKTLDLPHFIVEQLKLQRPELADELLRADGKLSLHGDCTHEIEEFLEPSFATAEEVQDVKHSKVIECPVCSFSVRKEADGCERCGHSFDEKTLVKS